MDNSHLLQIWKSSEHLTSQIPQMVLCETGKLLILHVLVEVLPQELKDQDNMLSEGELL